MVLSVSGVYLMVPWLPSTMTVSYHQSLVGKESNSKFEVWFLLNVYRFHTIVKLKKSNDGKSGTV